MQQLLLYTPATHVPPAPDSQTQIYYTCAPPARWGQPKATPCELVEIGLAHTYPTVEKFDEKRGCAGCEVANIWARTALEMSRWGLWECSDPRQKPVHPTRKTGATILHAERNEYINRASGALLLYGVVTEDLHVFHPFFRWCSI